MYSILSQKIYIYDIHAKIVLASSEFEPRPRVENHCSKCYNIHILGRRLPHQL